MRVDFKPKISNGRLTGGSISIHRDGGPKIYSDSSFWHKVKTELQKQGHDVIKKLMWKDGHLKDDNEYYVRSRKYLPDSFMISQTDFAIRSVYDDYNTDGVMSALVIDNSMNNEAIDAHLAKKQSKYSVSGAKKSGAGRKSAATGMGRIR